MEKILKPYDKEYMKMAMLKHEETFREQVYELHRLYQIQKMLMKNIGSSRSNGQNQNRRNSKFQNFDLEQPAEEYIAELDGNGVLENEDEREIELTLGLASHYQSRKLERPRNSDSGPSFSSSSSGSSHIKRTSSNINQTDRTREGLSGQKWGLVGGSDSNRSFLNGRKNSSDVEEQLRQDRLKQPPWLFQVLSLKMT